MPRRSRPCSSPTRRNCATRVLRGFRTSARPGSRCRGTCTARTACGTSPTSPTLPSRRWSHDAGGTADAPALGLFDQLNTALRFPVGHLYWELDGTAGDLATTAEWGAAEWLTFFSTLAAVAALTVGGRGQPRRHRAGERGHRRWGGGDGAVGRRGDRRRRREIRGGSADDQGHRGRHPGAGRRSRWAGGDAARVQWLPRTPSRCRRPHPPRSPRGQGVRTRGARRGGHRFRQFRRPRQ